MVVMHIKDTLINAGDNYLFTATANQQDLIAFVKSFPDTKILLHGDCKSQSLQEMVDNMNSLDGIYIIADPKDAMLIKIAYPDTVSR